MSAPRRAVVGLIAIAVVAASAVLAAPQSSQEASKKGVPVCPPEIPLRDIAVKWPDGWEGEVPGKYSLHAVGVIQGTEANHEGDILPESKKHKGKLVVYYAGLDGFANPRWLSCSYGNNSGLRLYKRLPAGIKECVIRYEETYGSPGSYDLESYHCE
jgi:hypothetical protein